MLIQDSPLNVSRNSSNIKEKQGKIRGGCGIKINI